MHVFTIGHSTRTIDVFAAELVTHHIVTLADIRSIPGSNRFPQFNAEALAAALAEAGIDYVHLEALGGRRNRSRDIDPETNAAWRNRSFRNYADYACTQDFDAGLAELSACDAPICIMCAEAVPWRCHRTIVSDHLVARGHTVTHLMGTTTKPHVLGAWGPRPTVLGTSVTYPAPETTNAARTAAAGDR
ncbi:MAG: DUF488 domain-containing protein [Actinobacteria bacterium]|nr:DUF488 domain-containing protein [Actinomycetota bacterium]